MIIFSILVLCLPKPSDPKFVIQDKNNQKYINQHSIALFESFIIPQPKFLAAAHSAALEVLPNGNLIATWFAGSHEGKPDVKIWQSIFVERKWELAHTIITPVKIAHDTDQYIRKVGNPLVYRSIDNHLHLFVVSVGLGGWSGSSLTQFISQDLGKTWGAGHKLILSPFLNISTLIRTKAITLADGGFYLPVYHEFIRTYPELLRFDKNGNFISQTRLNSHNTLMQPAILPVTPSYAYVFMRNHTRNDNPLYYQTTNNGGISWTKLSATNLNNQDSSLAVEMVESNQYLMVHNIGGRDKLSLAVSNDGINWQDIYLLENTPHEEFSYPAIQVHAGIIDILYTWKRRNIKHVEFNLSWLNQHYK